MASIASDEWLREQRARIERAQEETRIFCEAQHALAMADIERSKKLGGWLDVIQAITVASVGAGSAALMIMLLSSATPACH